MNYRKFCLAALLLALWQLASTLHLISPLTLPGPLAIIQSWRVRLGADLLTTVGRAVIGTLLGSCAAYFLHALALRAGLASFLDRQVGLSRALPVVALLPILIIWFGFSEFARTLVVAICALCMLLPVIHESMGRMPRHWQLLLERGHLSWWRHYLFVQIPWSVAEVGSALRVVFAIALSVSIASEYMGAEIGVGKFLDSARGTFNMPALWLGALLTGLAGALIDRGLVLIREKILFWEPHKQ